MEHKPTNELNQLLENTDPGKLDDFLRDMFNFGPGDNPQKFCEPFWNLVTSYLL